VHSQQHSPFARALAAMNPDERARAQRLRDAFNIREDDAIWVLCALTKGFDIALREIPTKCSEAADHVARWEFAPKGAGSNTDPTEEADDRMLSSVVNGSLFVITIVLVGSSAFTVGATLHTGSAYWAPGDSLAHGGASYLLRTVWTFPLAGCFAIVGLMLLAVGAAARRLWRAALPSPPTPSHLGH
jgi:hypothetical protein